MILQKENWVVADDLPAMGFDAEVILFDGNRNVAFLNKYDERALIITKYADNPNDGVSYYAPIEIIGNVIEYVSNLE